MKTAPAPALKDGLVTGARLVSVYLMKRIRCIPSACVLHVAVTFLSLCKSMSSESNAMCSDYSPHFKHS